MGRRRERTKWSTVCWTPDKKTDTRSRNRGTGGENPAVEPKKFRRNLALLAPRFAKSLAATIPEEGAEEDCSFEDLPDGFTKIRYDVDDVVIVMLRQYKRLT